MDRTYHPEFERALARLLIAAADTAEFADDKPHGRSRTASIRRLKHTLEELQHTAEQIATNRSNYAQPPQPHAAAPNAT
jgi:hypothetical protein